MAPRFNVGTIIILDIGKNVSTSDDKDQKCFFSEARDCAAKVIERKILSQGNNYLGIILLGSKNTNNTLAEQSDGAFRHIAIQAELQEPTWKMIDDLPKTPTKARGDWMDAVIVAVDHLNNGGVKFSSKKIILMTNFKSPTGLEKNDIEQVMNGFMEDGLELDVIGPDLLDDTLKEEDIDLARQFVEKTNGASASFVETMRYLLFHKKKAVNPMPWNTDLAIGPNIKIPISAYIRLKDEPAIKKWTKSVKDPVTLRASTTESIVTNRVHVNTENHSIVDPFAVIDGYHYGQQIIPFTECDKTLLYDSGERGLAVYGFTHTSNINWQNLRGDGLSYIFGRKGDKKAQHAMRCFVECLNEMNIVAIARRVYNKGNAPKMFAVMPVIDNDNYVCLSMAELCYYDEIKFMTFPQTNLKRYEYTNEQVNAFKELIKTMDLTKAYDETFDDTEAFPIAETVSPSMQYVLDCIAFRARNPCEPLPQPRDEIMMLFNTPPLIEKRSREPLEKLKSLFTLTKVEKKTRERKKATDTVADNLMQVDEDRPSNNQINDEEMPLIKLPLKRPNTVCKIGTVTPVQDFKVLKDEGKNLSDLSSEMAEAIENLVYFNLDGTFNKAIAAMQFFRSECVSAFPAPYNSWLLKFKKALVERKKEEFINLIHENKIDLILKEENSLSVYDEINGNDNEMYENDTLADATELTMDKEINDLFDEM